MSNPVPAKASDLFARSFERVAQAARHARIDPETLLRLSAPRRIVEVSTPVRMDDGSLRLFRSWFEWLQNRAGSYWPLEEVRQTLHACMRSQFHAVHDRIPDHRAPMRVAAYALALERLDRALAAGGTAADFARR